MMGGVGGTYGCGMRARSTGQKHVNDIDADTARRAHLKAVTERDRLDAVHHHHVAAVQHQVVHASRAYEHAAQGRVSVGHSATSCSAHSSGGGGSGSAGGQVRGEAPPPADTHRVPRRDDEAAAWEPHRRRTA
eukprot:276957-Chlamydomonas_euryale.AAC.4